MGKWGNKHDIPKLRLSLFFVGYLGMLSPSLVTEFQGKSLLHGKYLAPERVNTRRSFLLRNHTLIPNELILGLCIQIVNLGVQVVDRVYPSSRTDARMDSSWRWAYFYMNFTTATRVCCN